MIPNHDMSFHMFSSRAAASLRQQIVPLVKLGDTDVQPFFFGPPDQPMDDYVTLLQTHGQTAKSAQFTPSLFTDRPSMVQDIVHQFAGTLVVCPWINHDDRPTDVADWQSHGHAFAAITLDFAMRGPTFAYHNHGFEMFSLPNGTYPIDQLSGDSVPFEPDLAGKVVGGAALGHGAMDWHTLWDVSVIAGAQLMVEEHDLPNDGTLVAIGLIKTIRCTGGASS